MSDLATRLAQSTLSPCQIPSPIGEERLIADHVERCRMPGASHRGRRVFGLGSSDMKGGLEVMMALAEDLPRAELPVNLVVVLYEREEGPYLESGLGPLFDTLPELKQVKFGIAMEPTDGVVQVGCVGSLHVTLRFKGRGAHSARPWQGENAIHKAGPLLAPVARTLPGGAARVEVAGHATGGTHGHGGALATVQAAALRGLKNALQAERIPLGDGCVTGGDEHADGERQGYQDFSRQKTFSHGEGSL